MNDIIILTGPTGSGKTEISYKIAKKLPIEIINVDSMSLYKELNIGVAKPSIEEFKKFPHHLFNIISITEELNAFKFMNLAHKTIKEIKDRGNIPLLVGGCGFYIDCILFGMYDTNVEIKNVDPDYNYLKSIDPGCDIHPNDTYRIKRAVSIYQKTNRKPSEIKKEFEQNKKSLFNYKMFMIKIDRQELYNQINKRVDKMIEIGLVDETKELIQKFSTKLKIFKSIGYKEIIEYLENKTTLEQAIEDIKKRTRHLAKRQFTWFRKKKILCIEKEKLEKFNNYFPIS